MRTTEILTIGQLLAGAPLPQLQGGTVRHLDLGPGHPTRSGVLLVEVGVDSGVVVDARVQPGLNHRSVEKLFEVRDYRQALLLADRHDWQAAFSGELGLALACEQQMGLVPPVRATWLRMVLAEHARIASHLAHLSFVAHHRGDAALSGGIQALREKGRQLLLATSGNRVHPMMNRIGGVAHDISADHVGQLRTWATECGDCAGRIEDLLTRSGLGCGIGQLNCDDVEQLGLSGPVARASGIDLDLRRRSNYLAYEQVRPALEPRLHQAGDAAARLRVLCDDVRQSAAVIALCSEQLADLQPPVDTRLSKIVKLPDGEGYLAIEAPWGIAGFHVVSRATPTPWRLRLRTPSFANVQALETALVGCPVDETAVVVASLGWTAGDLDK